MEAQHASRSDGQPIMMSSLLPENAPAGPNQLPETGMSLMQLHENVLARILMLVESDGGAPLRSTCRLGRRLANAAVKVAKVRAAHDRLPR